MIHIQNFFQSWLIQNTIVFLLLGILLLIFLHLRKREYWQLAFQDVFRSRRTKICFSILLIYIAIALLDSVGWRRPMKNEQGRFMRTQTGQIILDKGASALDYLLSPLARKKERSYSAPLAKVQYTTSNERRPDGKTHRIHHPLNHPGLHLLGTDIIGEDVLVQSLKSIRTGLVIGLLNTLLAIPFALIFGLCAGYYGGWIDDLIQYICAVLSSIPSILLIAAVMIIAGRGLPQLCLAMGLASWTGLCRLLRGEALKLREADYVQAAVSLGVSSPRIILRHILPNVLHIVLISIVLRFSGEVLAEAALTYLGIGVDANTMSWGTMINDARTELTRSPMIWWKLSAAFLFMLGLVLPANLFGDALRDALDPRLRR